MAVLLVQTEMEPLEAEDAVTAVTIPSPLTIAVRQKALQSSWKQANGSSDRNTRICNTSHISHPTVVRMLQ